MSENEYRITFNLSVQTPKYPTNEWTDEQITQVVRSKLKAAGLNTKNTAEFPKVILTIDTTDNNNDATVMQSLQLSWPVETWLTLAEHELGYVSYILPSTLENTIQEALGDNYKNIQLTDIKAELQK